MSLRHLAFAWTLTILLLTLAPYNFSRQVAKADSADVLVSDRYRASNIADMVGNIVLFVPCGVLWAARRRTSFQAIGGPTYVAAAVSAAALSSTIELLQQYLPSRDSSLVDLLTNTAGGLLGVRGAEAWHGMWGARVVMSVRSADQRQVLCWLALCSALALVATAGIGSRTRLVGWDAGYMLSVGNERSGNRPWRGTVASIHLGDRATSAEDLRRFASGASRRIESTNLARYEMTANGQLVDVTGTLPHLKLTGPAGGIGSNAPVGRGQQWLESVAPPAEIARRTRVTNEFTLRVLCTSRTQHQYGPARIVSYSQDTEQRNYTLGQEGDGLVFRVRTPQNGRNGRGFELVVNGVFTNSGAKDILVTFGGGVLAAAVYGSDEILRVRYSAGSSLFALFLPPRVEDAQVYRRAFPALAVLPSAILLAIVPLDVRKLSIIGIVWLALFVPSLEWIMSRSERRGFEWHDVTIDLAVAAAASVATFLAWRLGRAMVQ